MTSQLRQDRCENKKDNEKTYIYTYKYFILTLLFSICVLPVTGRSCARFFFLFFFLVLACHTSCLCSHYICPRQVSGRPLVSVLRISPDFQILVSSRFVNLLFLRWIIDYVDSNGSFLLLWTPLFWHRFTDLIFNYMNAEIDRNIWRKRKLESDKYNTTRFFFGS